MHTQQNYYFIVSFVSFKFLDSNTKNQLAVGDFIYLFIILSLLIAVKCYFLICVCTVYFFTTFATSLSHTPLLVLHRSKHSTLQPLWHVTWQALTSTVALPSGRIWRMFHLVFALPTVIYWLRFSITLDGIKGTGLRKQATHVRMHYIMSCRQLGFDIRYNP